MNIRPHLQQTSKSHQKAWSSDDDVKLFSYSAIIERAFVEKWDVKYPYISRSWKNN
jgi:hypothetical protein